MKPTELKQMSDSLPSPRSQAVVVAINGKKNSKYVIKWALDNFLPKESPVFKLLHVCVTITSVPTPMGLMRIEQAREDIAQAYKQEVEWKTTEMLALYKGMFLERKVQVDVLRIEGDDIANIIANEVTKGRVDKLVIGASSRGGMFRRKVNGEKYSSRITEMIPSYCTVYAITKGKIASVRESSMEIVGSVKDVNSDTSWNEKVSSVHQPSSETSGYIRDDNNVVISSKTSDLESDSAVSKKSLRRGQCSAALQYHSSDSPAMQTFEALSTIKQALPTLKTDLTVLNPTRNKYLDIIEEEADLPSFSDYSDRVSTPSLSTSFHRQIAQNHSWISDTVSEDSTETPSEKELIMSLELEKLRMELKHTRGMYAMAQSETLEASQKLKEMNKSRLREQGMPKEGSFTGMTKSPFGEKGMPKEEVRFKDEQVEEVVKPEQVKYEDGKREANYVSEYATQREALGRQEAETKSVQDTREKENLQVAHFGPKQQYKKFAWDEIVTATSSFSENLIIGKGAAGTVYKCNLHYTTAAVKVLHSRELQSIKQFQQELEILSRIRHPYLVLLLGACPEQGCLVYEYMENGSLEDRLLRKNKTNPIPWFDRFRIAWEIASGLVFLHNSKPKQIIHRDLKPANILLDHNLGSKIGDVGLSKMVQSQDAFAGSMYNQTALVGTLSYIDPEYQRTGLNSPKSDVYAFGLILLQLLTAKSTTALTHKIETALKKDNLAKILDRNAGQWPLTEAKELAILGLRCADLRRRDRPDMKDYVLPKLELLRAAADRARDAAYDLSVPPSHFLCPIIKEIMNDPCVASDGYTYDRTSIETWLKANDKSPMTEMTLPTKNLIPNFTLLSAISQWKSEQA